MKTQTSSITVHNKKPGGPWTRNGKTYFRSIIGRFHGNNWVPYMFAPKGKKGEFQDEPMTPQDTLKVLGTTEKFGSDLANARAEIAKGKRKAAKEFKKAYKERKK